MTDGFDVLFRIAGVLFFMGLPAAIGFLFALLVNLHQNAKSGTNADINYDLVNLATSTVSMLALGGGIFLLLVHQLLSAGLQP